MMERISLREKLAMLAMLPGLVLVLAHPRGLWGILTLLRCIMSGGTDCGNGG